MKWKVSGNLSHNCADFFLSYTFTIWFLDLLEDVGEISEILGRSYGMPDGVEEEDLDAELACLEDELAAEDVDFGTEVSSEATATVPAGSSALSDLPSQPTNVPTVFSSAQATASANSPLVTANSLV
jgi:hypothetical protein